MQHRWYIERFGVEHVEDPRLRALETTWPLLIANNRVASRAIKPTVISI